MITEQDVSSAYTNYFKAGDATLKHGIVLPDEHPTDPSLYKVNIGDMTASANSRIVDGLWCTNAMTPFVRFRDMNNNPISYGSYMPIVPYMPVTVMFPNGGAGQGMIIGPSKTNVGLPDPENREGLHMLAQTPKGSWIAIDDKTGNIQIMYEKGNSSIVLSEENVTIEIGKGDASGKAHDTSLSLSRGSFIFKMRDAMMKFDEAGFSIGFDAIEGQEKSSSFLVSRDSIKAQAGKNMQLNAQDSISAKAEKITFEGTKDASLVGNHVKVNGAQLTSIKGNQIELEAFWNVQLKAMHIGLKSKIKHTEESAIKQTKNYIETKRTTGIVAHSSTLSAHQTAVFAICAGANLQDTMPINEGAGCAAAIPAYQGTKAIAKAAHVMLKAVGQMFMLKTLPIAVVTNILGTGWAMAAAGNRAENPSKFLFHSKDAKNKKSINSGIATTYSRKNEAMENLAVVDPLIESSMTALYTGGQSATAGQSSQGASSTTPGGSSVSQMVLEAGIGGVAELATQPSGNTIGLDVAGITMTGSCALLAPAGTCATLRKSIVACDGYGGTTAPETCGTDGYNTAASTESKFTSAASHLLTQNLIGSTDGAAGTCGGEGAGTNSGCVDSYTDCNSGCG